MTFFDFLAQEKRSSDENFRTASVEASRESEDRFGSFLSTYGPQGFDLIRDEFLSLTAGIADSNGVGDRVEAIQKAAFFGITNPLMPDDRRHWSQEDWDQHFHNLGEQRLEHGPVTRLPKAPFDDNTTPRPGLDRLNPADYPEPPRQLPAVIPRAAAKSDEGGPVPKMDKRLWTPKNVKPLKTDDPKGKNPSKMVDPSVPVIKRNADDLEGIGEATTERYDLNKDKQKA